MSRSKRTRGTSLVESVVAMSLFVSFGVPLFGVLGVTTQGTGATQDYLTAQNLCEMIYETISRHEVVNHSNALEQLVAAGPHKLKPSDDSFRRFTCTLQATPTAGDGYVERSARAELYCIRISVKWVGTDGRKCSHEYRNLLTVRPL